MLKAELKWIMTGLGLLLLVSCAPSHYAAQDQSSFKNHTGHKTEDGRDFTVGKEPRLEEEKIKIIEELKKEHPQKFPEEPAPENSKSQEQEDPGETEESEEAEEQITSEEFPFRRSLKEFRFLRYDQDAKAPARLGTKSYSLQVYIQPDGGTGFWVGFSGALRPDGNQLRFQNTSQTHSEYQVNGSLSSGDKVVVGRFELSRKTSKGGSETEEATILYKAYEANLNVRTPLDKNLKEFVNLNRKVENLKEDTKAWVNDFVVPFGVSTFDVAIIRRPKNLGKEKENTDSWEELLEFKGRSVETDNPQSEALKIHSLLSDVEYKSMKLIGNAEGEDSKIFSMTLKDDKGEDTELLLDVARPKSAKELEEERKQEEAEEEEDSQRSEDASDKEPPQPLPAPADSEKEDVITPDTRTEKSEPLPPPPQEQILEDEEELPFTLPETGPVPVKRPTPPKNPSGPSGSNASSAASLGNNSKSYISTSQGGLAAKIVKAFDATFEVKGVKKAYNKILRNSAEKERLKAFFKFANPFRSMISTIASAYKVLPQFAYVAVIESNYFTGGRYSIDVSTSESSTGPFQINRRTAKQLEMNFVRNGIGVRPPPSDERLYFASSACAAAKYFLQNANQFPRDYSLSILAYNQGAGGTRSYARRYGYSYREISDHKMPGTAYADKKLAAYFIAGTYKNSEFDVDSVSKRNLPANANIFPAGTIKDPTCRRATAPYR